MNFEDFKIKDFIKELASKEPIPGGGGVSALVGSLGVALGSMVGNLTLGKKKYEEVQEDIKNILDEASELQGELLSLIQKDADLFEPLSKAYGLPKDTDEEKQKRSMVLETALQNACSVPLEIMNKSLKAISLHEKLLTNGTRIAISDVGVGVLLCKSALMGASLNIFINTNLMKDKEYAEKINTQVNDLLIVGIKRADIVYQNVEIIIKQLDYKFTSA